MADCQKQTNSFPYFRNTRVASCQYVLARKGSAFAVSFPHQTPKWKCDNLRAKRRRASDYVTISSNSYQKLPVCHLGMPHKPLIVYHPNCSRSRLATLDPFVASHNASSLSIGHRQSFKPQAMFKTTYQAELQPGNCKAYITNPAILAQQVQRRRAKLREL